MYDIIVGPAIEIKVVYLLMNEPSLKILFLFMIRSYNFSEIKKDAVNVHNHENTDIKICEKQTIIFP